MAVPRNRLSNARKNSRRAHHAKTPKNFGKCTRCSSPKLPHVVCPSCLTYDSGKVSLAIDAQG